MRKTVLLFALLAVMAAAGIASCDNTLTPVDHTSGFFSIYGTLDLFAEENYVRIKDLNEPLSEHSNRELQATVSLENLNTGHTEILEDTVVKFGEVYTHNFRINSNIQPGTAYRVTAEDPDGEKSFAITQTPDFAATHMMPSMPDCTTRVEISFNPVFKASDLGVDAGIEFEGDRYLVYTVPRNGEGESKVNVQFTPRELISRLSDFNGLESAPWCHELSDDRLHLSYTHYGPDFYAQSGSDTTSIPGGVGRFGAFYRDTVSFTFDTSNVCFPFC